MAKAKRSHKEKFDLNYAMSLLNSKPTTSADGSLMMEGDVLRESKALLGEQPKKVAVEASGNIDIETPRQKNEDSDVVQI